MRSDYQADLRVRGWVTFVDQVSGFGFVQDRTGGLAFRVPPDGGGVPPVGTRVEMMGRIAQVQDMLMLSGVSGDEKGEPTLPKITVLSAAPIPDMLPRQFDLTEASHMQVHAELTHLRAIVRRILPPVEEGGPWRVEISSRKAMGVALLPWDIAKDALQRWKDREVDVTGVLVCRASPEILPANADAAIFVPNVDGWKVRAMAMEPFFATPPLTAEGLRKMLPRVAVDGRVHVRGVVTAALPFRSLYLRTVQGSIQVETPQRTLFQPGEEISAICWPEMKRGRVTLTDGICRRLNPEKAVELKPVKLDVPNVEWTHHEGELVCVEGTIRDFFVSERWVRVLLGLDRGGTCSAYQSLRPGGEPPARLRLGTRVEVAGICQRAGEEHLTGYGASFAVMLRGLEDMRVVAAAPTVSRLELIWLSWILAGTALVVAVGVAVLRQKVRRQQKVIEAITRRAASTEERRRIASEFHDHLNQHLVSASLHLETIHDALDRKPSMVPALLADAVKMLRQCREEARNVIWNLRLGEEDRDLADLLRLWVEIRQKSSTGVQITFEVIGEAFPILGDHASNIVRIAQEAVNNALRHAGARHVTLILKFGPERALSLTIEDDGCGFSKGGASEGDTGHYGLRILRERAERIRGRLDIRSEKEKGTRVRLVVPQVEVEEQSDD